MTFYLNTMDVIFVENTTIYTQIFIFLDIHSSNVSELLFVIERVVFSFYSHITRS